MTALRDAVVRQSTMQPHLGKPRRQERPRMTAGNGRGAPGGAAIVGKRRQRASACSRSARFMRCAFAFRTQKTALGHVALRWRSWWREVGSSACAARRKQICSHGSVTSLGAMLCDATRLDSTRRGKRPLATVIVGTRHARACLQKTRARQRGCGVDGVRLWRRPIAMSRGLTRPRVAAASIPPHLPLRWSAPHNAWQSARGWRSLQPVPAPARQPAHR